MKSLNELLQFSIINIDKPSGPTSFSVSSFVRRMLKLNKTSHLGTLDPIVTGVLPVALGRACRLNEVLMHRDKTYVGIMRLHKEISQEELEKQMKKFIGKINQLPPVKSRVKRAIREREIKTFEILEISDKDVLFVCCVQAGTYIRKLIHDLGEKIGGAHMLELRRTQAGIFTEEKIFNLYEFESAVKALEDKNEEPIRKMIIPAEEIIKKVIPCIQIKESSLKQILTGKPLMKLDVSSKEQIPEERFAVFFKDRFIAIMHPVSEKDIIAKADFVFN